MPLMHAFRSDSRESRHLAFLAEFTIGIEDMPASQNCPADALSCITAISDLSLDILAQAQHKDDEPFKNLPLH